MKELKEIRFNETDVILKDNLVRGSILPEKIAELNRNIIFAGDTIVEGPIFGNRIEVRDGNVDIQGAVFAQTELYVSSDMNGSLALRKSVGSANSIVSRADGVRPTFYSDVNARTVALHNAFVAGSIYADEITLDNCVVVGGVFATGEISLNNCMVGTFNSPTVQIQGDIYLLLPSAFSISRIMAAPGCRMFNLSLADLGSLYRGLPQNPESGSIAMSLDSDEVKSILTGENDQRTILCYTVAGKVLAADLIDTDKFQNHFLLTAAALGSQLLRTYDLGPDAEGKPATLSVDRIRDFLFDILSGRIEVQPMDGSFSLSEFSSRR